MWKRSNSPKGVKIEFSKRIAYTATFLILIFSLLDGFFTLHLLDNGAIEVNPLMSLAMKLGDLFFLTLKFSITLFCLGCLLSCKNSYLLHFRFSVESALQAIMTLYGTLIIYELSLIAMI